MLGVQVTRHSLVSIFRHWHKRSAATLVSVTREWQLALMAIALLVASPPTCIYLALYFPPLSSRWPRGGTYLYIQPFLATLSIPLLTYLDGCWTIFS